MKWLAPLALLLVMFGVYALTATRSTVSLDAYSANVASWRIATAGTPSLDGVSVPALDDHEIKQIWIVEGADGERTVGRAPGVIAVALPAYWLAQPARMTLWPGALTAALASALAVMLLYLSIDRLLSRRQAILSATVFGLTTPVWTVSANAVWPHTVTVLGITGMAWAASRNNWLLVGIFGGATLWGRLHAAVVVAVVGTLVGFSRRSPRIVVLTATASGALLALSCAWNRWVYGSWDPTAAYDGSAFTGYAAEHRFSLSNQLGLWVSPDRGVLVWTPLLVLLTPALVRSWRDLPDWSRSMLLGGLAYSVLQATLNRFSGGDGFYGYRIGLEFVAAAAPAFALSAVQMGSWAKRLIGPVIGLQACAILTGAAVEAFFVPTDRVWIDNAFAVALRSNPLALSFILLASVLAGVLGQRIWANPRLERQAIA